MLIGGIVSRCVGSLSEQMAVIVRNKVNKPVGFYGPIAPPVPNAPSSECPQASIAARCRATDSVRISHQASCCCSSAIAGIAIGKLQNLSPVVGAGFCTSKGELVRSILFPKEVMFKFYEDAVKFVGVLACLATIGMIYSATTLIIKHVSVVLLLYFLVLDVWCR